MATPLYNNPLWQKVLRCWAFIVFLILIHAAASYGVLAAIIDDEFTLKTNPSLRALGDHANKKLSPLTTKSNAVDNNTIPAASLTVPLHSHSGTHHVFVHVGSPIPQRQTLILDTGSRYMAFPCEPWCEKCGIHHSPKFNGTQSTTLRHNYFPNCIFAKQPQMAAGGTAQRQQGGGGPRIVRGFTITKDNACVFHQTYREGSTWTAKEMEDVLWLGTWDHQESTEEYMSSAIPFTFGCQTSVTGDFVSQYADGILGLARSLDENAFLNTMVKADAIDRPAFATCMTRQGGTLSLGGSGLVVGNNGGRTSAQQQNDAKQQSKQHHLEPMAFTKIQQGGSSLPGLYAIRVSKVFVGDICITCHDARENETSNLRRQQALKAFGAGKGTLLDSGTTDTFFPTAALTVFKRAWQEYTGFPMKEMRQYSFAEFHKIPAVILIFEPNATLVIPASSYMEGVPMVEHSEIASSSNSTVLLPDEVKPWTGTQLLTMRLYMEEKGGAVLGANAMYNHDILYDLQERRIGIARAYCG